MPEGTLLIGNCYAASPRPGHFRPRLSPCRQPDFRRHLGTARRTWSNSPPSGMRITMPCLPAMRRASPFVLAAVLAAGAQVASTRGDGSEPVTPGGALLTVDRIFDSEDFKEERLGPLSVGAMRSPAYFTLDAPQAGGEGRDLVRNDPASRQTRKSSFRRRPSSPPGEPAARRGRLRVLGRRVEAADLHQQQARLAAQHARRLLGAGPGHAQTAEARRRCPAVHAHVRQVLARRHARRLRPREQPLRPGSATTCASRP